MVAGGLEIEFYKNEYPNWVNAIVLTADMELVLVKQYRHGSGTFMLESPGGMIDDGEEAVDAIVREVYEETGYQSADAPIFLGEFYANPATSNNKVSTYLLLNAVPTGSQHLDKTEQIEVLHVPFHAFGQMLREGEAKPIFTGMGYYLAKAYLDANAPSPRD